MYESYLSTDTNYYEYDTAKRKITEITSIWCDSKTY